MKLSDTDLAKLKYSATVCSITLAVILTIIKAVAAFFTGSLSILSSLVDGLSDIVSSCISMIAVRYSDKPFTTHHRYGYGKAEAVSALVQAAFIVGSAGFILYDGIYRFIYPVQIQETGLGIIIMLLCLILTCALVLFQRYVIRVTKSQAIAADSLHYVVDILSNSSVIISLTVVRYLHWEWFDIATAIFISIYLIYNAWQLTLEALEEITDKELDNDIKENIIHLAKSVDGVMGCHDLRTRVSGNHWFAEIHLELDGNKTLFETHALSDSAENKIIAVYPHLQLIIHQDPYGLSENRIDHIIKEK